MYIQRRSRIMKVARWGNSLAIRIPADVAAALELKEGDEVKVTAKDAREVVVEKDSRREEALARLTELARKAKFPPGWKFDREEIYEERIRQLSK
jgi:antitoxin MazE